MCHPLVSWGEDEVARSAEGTSCLGRGRLDMDRVQQMCPILIVWGQDLRWVFVLWILGRSPGVSPCLIF